MPQTDPLVSVIIPVYNCARYLEIALDSIIYQSYHNLEIILIDDGSTDESEAVLSSYTDKRIRFFKNMSNLGIPKTKNKGLSLANGKYIVNMDGDDYSFPQRIRTQIDFMETHDKFGLLGCWTRRMNPHGRSLPRPWKPVAPPERIPSLLLFNNYFNHPSTVIRKSAIPAGGYNTEFSAAQDYELWVRIAERWFVWNFPKFLFKHRVHGSSVTKTKSTKKTGYFEKMIYARQLERLGVTGTEDELDLHFSLINKSFAVDADVMDRIKAWFDKLLAANEKTGYFRTESLHTVISDYWDLVCRRSARYSLAGGRHLFNSPFRTNKRPGLRALLRFWPYAIVCRAKGLIKAPSRRK